MIYLVGGRFACMTCLRRRTEGYCARCGERADVIDLESTEGRFRLSMIRAAGRLGTLGIPFWNPRAFSVLPIGRAVLRIGMAISFALAFSWPFLHDRGFSYDESTQLELVTRTVVATALGFAGAAAWVVAVTIVVLVLLGIAGVLAQTMNALARGIELLARVLPGKASVFASRVWLRVTVAAQQNVMRGALESVERAFTPRLRAEPPVGVLAGAPLRGTLRASGSAAPIVAVLEDTGALEVRDARVLPFELVADDGAVAAVEVASGCVEFTAEREHAEGPVAQEALPAWADADPDRRARVRCLVVAAGARVEITGGEWSEEIDRGGTGAGFRTAPVRRVLRGTADSPARIRVV